MRQIREIISGKKCVIYADEQPQVLLIQPVGEHEDATLDAEIEAIKEAVHVPFVFAGLAISDRYGKLPVVLGGYSLAGLFARWAVCKEECFDAVASASPSLWIVAWKGFSDAHEVYARYVYLSLGDREEITKNKAIAQVGTNVRWEYDHLQRTIGPDHCTLVWEKGGHFVTPHLRLARAFAWCVNSLTN